MRRAKPLLGTVVEVTASGPRAESALAAAFRAVEKVHAAMSYHDATSELSRLNREAHRHPVRVGRETFAVLQLAQELATQSEGVFDVTVAPRLVEWGFLPAESPCPRGGSWQDIALDRKARTVAFRRPLRLDLGGIAKGYAVDRAVAAMRRAGATAGCVNAGGDLRGFGKKAWPVQLRHPAQPELVARGLSLRDAAAATSAAYFTARRWRGAKVSPLLNGCTRRTCDGGLSATVLAPSAAVADALTKIVLALREKAAPLLAHYGADAFLLDPGGGCTMLGGSHDAPQRSPA